MNAPLAQPLVHLLAPARRDDPVARASASSGEGAAWACALQVATLPHHRVLILGSPDRARWMTDAMPREARARVSWLSLPGGFDRAAAWSLRRRVRALGRGAVVKAWDARAARLAAWAGVGKGPAPELWATVPWTAPERVPRPQLPEPDRTPDAAPTVALLVDPPELGDARAFVFMMGLLDVMEDPTIGVMHAAAARADAALRFHELAPVSWALRTTHAPFASRWEGVSLAVVLPVRGATLGRSHEWAVASAHAAGVPVVWAEARGRAALYPEAVLDDLTPRSERVRDVAGRVLQLVEDAPRLARCSRAVQAHLAGGCA